MFVIFKYIIPASCQQSMRHYATKPRWLPIAKTKIFRVSPRPKISPEELVEQRRLINHYNTQMGAIKYLLEKRYLENVTSEEVQARLAKEEEDTWQECMRINSEWNAKVGREREERVAAEFEKEKQMAVENLLQLEEMEREQIDMIDQMIREEKERAKHYITRENIDEAIEKALNTIHDFNYCIDMKNNIYYGTRGTVSATPREINELSERKEDYITTAINQ